MGGLTLLLNTGRLVCFRNYEQIVKAHQDNPNEGKDQVSDEVKFNVFQGLMDSLFQSFNASISVTSFQELSACVFSWIEEHCKPQVSPAAAGGLLRWQSEMRQRPLRTFAPSAGLVWLSPLLGLPKVQHVTGAGLGQGGGVGGTGVGAQAPAHPTPAAGLVWC